VHPKSESLKTMIYNGSLLGAVGSFFQTVVFKSRGFGQFGLFLHFWVWFSPFLQFWLSCVFAKQLSHLCPAAHPKRARSPGRNTPSGIVPRPYHSGQAREHKVKICQELHETG
jgi:hypothetical protein